MLILLLLLLRSSRPDIAFLETVLPLLPSFGLQALNKVDISYMFVAKTLLRLDPFKWLVGPLTAVVLIASYAILVRLSPTIHT